MTSDKKATTILSSSLNFSLLAAEISSYVIELISLSETSPNNPDKPVTLSSSSTVKLSCCSF